MDLARTKFAIKLKESINLYKDYAFVVVSSLHTLPSLTLMDSKQNTIEIKRSSKSPLPCDLLNPSCGTNSFQSVLQEMVFYGKVKHFLSWVRKIQEKRMFFY